MNPKYAKYERIGLPDARPVVVRERKPIPKWMWILAMAVVTYGAWHLWQAHLNYDGPVRNSPPPNATIYMLGDSMTAGFGADPGRDLVTLLSQKIGRSIINGGVNGDTTGGAVGRIPEMLRHNPGTVIVALGGNDLLRNVSVSDAEQNLSTIIEAAQRKGAMVVIIGLSGRPTDGYASMYARLARKYDCVLVADVLKDIFFDARYKADYIHPNSLGYELMASRIAEKIQKYL